MPITTVQARLSAACGRLGAALTRLGARVSAANTAFDDHPNGERFADRIETTTVDSVIDWLQRSGLATSVQIVL